MPKLKCHKNLWNNGHTWRLGNKVHHPTKPAVVNDTPTHRTEEWWLRGLRHRRDGPAYLDKRFDLYSNTWHIEIKIWFFKGWIHSAQGPAITFDDGTQEYWYMGAQLPELEWMVYAHGFAQFPDEKTGRDQFERNLRPFENRHA